MTPAGRLVVGLAAAASAAAGPLPQAVAQDAPQARISLVEQTPVVTADRSIRVAVQVTNTGERPLRSVGTTLWVYNPARSRSEYRAALQDEPRVEPVLVAPFPERVTLAAGEERLLVFERTLEELAVRGESALYPLKVQVENAEGVAVAQVRTAVVFVHERPLVPLNLGVTVVMDEEILFRPDGALLDESLPRAVSQGGSVEGVLAALESSPVQLTLVLSPLLVDQIDRMSRGYRVVTGSTVRTIAPSEAGAQAAGQALARLRSLVRDPRVEVVSLPLASPSVPALIEADLQEDLESQIVRGTGLLARLLPGAAFAEGLAYPPGGQVNARAVRVLRRLGVTTLLLEADHLAPRPDTGLTSPPVADVPAGRGRTLRAVVPDPAVETLLTARRRSAALRAQQAIGELAATWLEGPGTDRGAAVLFTGEPDADPELLRAFLAQAHASSSEGTPDGGWLRPAKASRIAAAARAPRRALRPSTIPRLSPLFVNGLDGAASSIAQLEDVTRADFPVVERLKRLLLASESRHFTSREHRGLALLRAIRLRVEQEFAKLDLPSGTAVTLTSRRGVIPLTMGNHADYPMRVRVRLVSPRLRFLEAGPRSLVLDRPRQAFTFPVVAHSTGRFPVRIVVETPRGSPIAESRIIVRSTAYNTRALLVVGAASLFLIALWGRRLLSARR